MNLKNMPFSAQFGVLVTITYLILALAAPLLAPYGETQIVGDIWEPFSSTFLLGTDSLGRDMLSRLLYGAQVTILIALLSTLLGFIVGSILGFFASIIGGWFDTVLSRIVDILMAIPTLIFALVVLSVVESSVTILILVIAVFDSTRVFRLTRSIGMNLVVMDFIEVARLRAESSWWILTHEILPNAMPPLLAEFGLRFCYSILFLSSLGFLGLGVQPPAADWGGMVRDNAEAIAFGMIIPIIPAVVIAVLSVAVNLLADWHLNRISSPAKGGH